ncbi:MAG: hypothetical protein R3B93_21030 [Bacteroidia bacterium]
MIITTVGTSLFSNYRKDEAQDKIGKNYQPIDRSLDPLEKENACASDIGKDIYEIPIREIKEKIEDYWFELNGKPNLQASAEITSIFKIAESQTNEKIQVCLIATDTLLSVLAAQMITDWIGEYYPDIEVISPKTKEKSINDNFFVVKDLRVDSQLNYDQGFINLIEVLEEICINKGKKQNDIILNITGGYKAIVPIVTLYGQLRNIPLYYIYDEDDLDKSANLVSVGKLPFHLDWGIVDTLKPFLNLEYHPLWTEKEGMELSERLANKEIEVIDNQFFRKSDLILEKIQDKKNELLIIKHLYDQKLISFSKEYGTFITALGSLLKSVNQLDGYRGLEMEYILYHFFANEKENELVKDYKTAKPISLSGSFRTESGKIVIRDDEPKKTWREFGDIDISLKKGNTVVLVELKAFSSFLSNAKEKDGEKYFNQIHARLTRVVQTYPERFNQENPSLEFLFIVYKFQFEGFSQDILDNETINIIYQKFKKLEEIEIAFPSKKETSDNKIENKKFSPTFRLLGVTCLIGLDLDKLSANFMNFYKEPSLLWEEFK